MRVCLVLSFFFLIFIFSTHETEVNFRFGSMIPSNSVSCNVATCPGTPEEELQSDLVGEVVGLNSDPATYDTLTSAWNTPRSSSKFIPTLVVVPETVEDVVAAVNYARENNLEISVRNGGHGQDGLSLTQRGLQVNFDGMKSVVIDVSQKVALIEPGCTNSDVNNAGRPWNLAHVGGNVGQLGFSGQTSFGAYGALSRMHGLGLDNVISVKIVTYDGKILNVSEESNPDLFWGVRGALSNFGIAVLWQVKLHDVSSWYGGNIVYPPTAISQVLQWAHEHADEDYFHFRGLFLADGQVFLTQWAHWDPRFTSQEKDAFFEPLQVVAPFYAWTVGEQDYYQNQASDDAVIDSIPKNIQRSYGVGAGAVNPSPAFFSKFQELCLDIGSPQGDCRFELWGGNISSHASWSSAFWSRDSQYMWTFEPIWFSPAEDQTYFEKANSAYETLRGMPEAIDGCYPNYISPDFSDICFGDNIARLRELKQQYDPDNFFHRNYNIEP